jgi:hypothetical protein
MHFIDLHDYTHVSKQSLNSMESKRSGKLAIMG